jgi:hypothetical protein
VSDLVGQENKCSIRGGAGRAPRLDEKHEGEQTEDLGFVGHEVGEEAPQPDRLETQILAYQEVSITRRVPLVEDQVDGGQHRFEAIGELGVARDTVGDVCGPDLCLGPDQSLSHRRFGNQECPRNLRRLQSSQQAKGKGDLGHGSKGRVTTREDQAETVVAHGHHLQLLIAGVQQLALDMPVIPSRFTAQSVDCSISGCRNDPSRRAWRETRRRPPFHGNGEGFLDRLLGGVDISEDTDEYGHGATGLFSEDSLDIGAGRRRCMHVSPRSRPGRGAPQPAVDTPDSRPRPAPGPRRDRAP